MDLTSFILLAIECNMVSNKFSLDIFYTAFKEAARNGNSEAEEEDFENRFILTNHNFFLALYNLSKALFAHDEKPFESMFAQMLTEKMVTHDKRRKCLIFIYNNPEQSLVGVHQNLDRIQTVYWAKNQSKSI